MYLNSSIDYHTEVGDILFVTLVKSSAGARSDFQHGSANCLCLDFVLLSFFQYQISTLQFHVEKADAFVYYFSQNDQVETVKPL